MTRIALLILTGLLAAATVAGAAPQTAAGTAAGTTTLVDFCITPDGICPLPRPAAPGTPCSCRWPKGTVSQGQAGE